jgi:hypothetical protein
MLKPLCRKFNAKTEPIYRVISSLHYWLFLVRLASAGRACWIFSSASGRSSIFPPSRKYFSPFLFISWSLLGSESFRGEGLLALPVNAGFGFRGMFELSGDILFLSITPQFVYPIINDPDGNTELLLLIYLSIKFFHAKQVSSVHILLDPGFSFFQRTGIRKRQL